MIDEKRELMKSEVFSVNLNWVSEKFTRSKDEIREKVSLE
jgi:hypothetical protein